MEFRGIYDLAFFSCHSSISFCRFCYSLLYPPEILQAVLYAQKDMCINVEKLFFVDLTAKNPSVDLKILQPASRLALPNRQETNPELPGLIIRIVYILGILERSRGEGDCIL